MCRTRTQTGKLGVVETAERAGGGTVSASGDLASHEGVDRARKLSVRVAAVRRESTDILSFELVDDQGGELPPWSPGAHIDVTLPSGLVRQYSLCGRLDDRSTYRIAVLREPEGKASRELHTGEWAGAKLSAFGPKNHFRLVSARNYIFLAGGIGVTPILPMVATVSGQGVPWRMTYGGRSRETMAFLEELGQWDHPGVDIVPESERGLPDLATLFASADDGTAVYACGPPAMLAAVRDAAAAASLLPGQVHVERFAPSAEVDDRQRVGDEAFEVELRRSGTVVQIPCGKTILSVVREFCPDVVASCEEGFCGTCETRVLGGIPDHRDEILTEEEQASNETMMICVGRAKSPRLVLDL